MGDGMYSTPGSTYCGCSRLFLNFGGKNCRAVGWLIFLSTLFSPVARSQNVSSDAQAAASASSSNQTSASTSPKNLADFDLDQLMNVQVQVTSVSKKEEDSFQAPAAIFVLTAEDIRRGGFASLPEALRMVPGLYVARANSNDWTIAARGFVQPNNDKLLVLLDGREEYDPFFGGVYWDVQDVPLEDIERVEVILGPGGTLYGDNAVNGVINIITKDSHRTQGALVSISSGIDGEKTTTVRYGGMLGGVAYRVFGKSSYWESAVDPVTGTRVGDQWTLAQGGFRADWKKSPNDTLTFEGQLYDGRTNHTEMLTTGPTVPIAPQLVSSIMAEESILTQWDHQLSDRASFSLLGYCVGARRSDPLGGYNRNDCDLEFQHNLAIGPRHSVNWGIKLFTVGDTLTQNFVLQFSASAAHKTTVSGFGQYEIKLIPDRLRIVAGTKLEHNPYAGFAVQPQIRAVWTPSKKQTAWAAFSRALKFPSRFETAGEFKGAEIPGPTYLVFVGNPNLKPEILKATEVGYRWQPSSFFSLDASAFYNAYKGTTIVPPLVTVFNPSPPFTELEVGIDNLGATQTHGGEFSVKFQPIRPWVISAAETELRGNASGFSVALLPRHFLSAQSHFNLPHTFTFDSALYYYDAIPGFAFGLAPPPGVPTHTRVDLGLSARPFHGVELSVWGNDIASPFKVENQEASNASIHEVAAVRRSAVFKLMWESKPE